ncbi:MAG: hypothetical protein OXN44_07370 [Acidimicrobiaceae bacterium]|nr:hypothetical protein [Acidimicrobiaceae bacterium]
MSSGARSRVLCLFIGPAIAAVLAIVREASIRRRIEDLSDWQRSPRPS